MNTYIVRFINYNAMPMENIEVQVNATYFDVTPSNDVVFYADGSELISYFRNVSFVRKLPEEVVGTVE